MIGDVLQPTHLIFILLVALLVLGPKRLPEVGRSLGRGIRDFRGALSGSDDRAEPEADADPITEPPPPPLTPATTSLEPAAVAGEPTPPVLVSAPTPSVAADLETSDPEAGVPEAPLRTSESRPSVAVGEDQSSRVP